MRGEDAANASFEACTALHPISLSLILVSLAVPNIRSNERFDKENARRRHNFIPFIVQLLKGLAGAGQLQVIHWFAAWG